MKLPSSHCFIETINLIETINFINIAIYHSSLLFLSHRTLLSLSLCLPLLPRLEARSSITFSVLTLSSLSPSSSNTCLHNPPSSQKKRKILQKVRLGLVEMTPFSPPVAGRAAHRSCPPPGLPASHDRCISLEWCCACLRLIFDS